MSERVIIVTGASSGIGRELAREASAAGFDVVAVARRADRLHTLAEEIERAGRQALAIPLDIRSAQAPRSIVQRTLDRFGRIDVLVHNAGAALPGTLLSQSDAAIDAQWQLHVAAPLRITREALPALSTTRGQVIFIGSGVARVPPPGFGAYCSAKAAMRAAAGQLYRELRDTGIAVTYVDPGTVDTEFSEASRMRRRTPQRLLLRPQFVARRIMRAIRSRPRSLHASNLQALALTIGELFPSLADAVMPGVADTPVEAAPVATESAQTPEQPAASNESEFDRALAPIARRMERVKLPPEFLVSLLQSQPEIQLSDAAMRWAGMPNKNERAAMAEALDALTSAGYLRQTAAESWEVLRAPR